MALDNVVTQLQQGKSIIISPEGRQNRNHLLKAKTGAAFLAIQTNTPILPVAIYSVKTKRNWLGFRKREWIITFGEPITPGNMACNRENLEQLTDRVMHEIADMLPKEMRGVYTLVP